MPESDTGETVTDVLHFPWHDGPVVHATCARGSTDTRPGRTCT